MKRKRTEIAIEFEEMIQIVAQERGVNRALCAACGGLVTMVTPQQASTIARVSVRTINRWVEGNAIHFIETADGLLLLCVNSLSPNEVPKPPIIKEPGKELSPRQNNCGGVSS